MTSISPGCLLQLGGLHFTRPICPTLQVSSSTTVDAATARQVWKPWKFFHSPPWLLVSLLHRHAPSSCPVVFRTAARPSISIRCFCLLYNRLTGDQLLHEIIYRLPIYLIDVASCRNSPDARPSGLQAGASVPVRASAGTRSSVARKPRIDGPARLWVNRACVRVHTCRTDDSVRLTVRKAGARTGSMRGAKVDARTVEKPLDCINPGQRA